MNLGGVKLSVGFLPVKAVFIVLLLGGSRCREPVLLKPHTQFYVYHTGGFSGGCQVLLPVFQNTYPCKDVCHTNAAYAQCLFRAIFIQ